VLYYKCGMQNILYNYLGDNMTGKWHYVGDVNPECGGVWMNLEGWEHGYCEAVRVEDLDGGCGFRGAVLIERLTVLFMDEDHRVREAFGCCGIEPSYKWCGEDEGMIMTDPDPATDAGKLIIAEALLSYGHYDPDDNGGFGKSSETIQLDTDSDYAPMEHDGWKAKFRAGDDFDLAGYVEKGWLS